MTDRVQNFAIGESNKLSSALESLVNLPWPLKRRILTTPSLWRVYRGICRRLGWNEARLGWYAANNGPYSGIHLHASHTNLLWLPMGGYEPWVSGWLVKLLTEERWGCVGKDVWDVGAYRGYLSLLCSKHGQGRVLSFEPDESNRQHLLAHMRANPTLSSRIEVLPLAAMECEGTIEFVSREAGLESQAKHDSIGLYHDKTGTSKVTQVRSVRLDSVFAQGRPAPGLLKIDVEGAETLALLGAVTLLKKGRPVVLLETHGENAYRTSTALLTQCGYRVFLLSGDRLSELPSDPISYGHVLASDCGRICQILQ